MRFLKFFLPIIAASGLLLAGCEHELIVPIAPDVIPNDTIPVDTGDYTGVPCDPDTIYFQNQVLPLLISNCAMSGCHDVQSHKEGVILTDYTNVKKHVKAFNPNGSKLYTVLFQEGEEQMPPLPAPVFTTEQKNLIKKWIEQGAPDNECNENYGGCDTTGITYTAFVAPLMANYCTGCHSGGSPSGNISLTTYAQVKASAQTGALYGSVAHLPGYFAMPDGGQQLSACYLKKIKAWIDSGMLQ